MIKIPEYTENISRFYDNFTNKALSNLFMLEFPMLNMVTELLWTLQWKKWLDFGCGLWQLAGRFTEGGAKMIGLDISPSQLEISKNKFPHIKFTHNVDDIKDKSLDFVLCKFSLCEMDPFTYEKNLKLLRKKLKQDWYLVIWDHNRDVCSRKETLCEKYADISEKQEWDQVVAILKNPGTLFNQYYMKEGVDYVKITDYYRPNKRVKKILKNNFFRNINIIPSVCPENPTWVPLDERNYNVYKVTIAQK